MLPVTSRRACGPANPRWCVALTVVLAILPAPGLAQENADAEDSWVSEHYEKREVQIPMRDGVRLFTAIYTPRDTSRTYPFLLKRTPYSVRPYGADQYPSSLGPSRMLAEDGYLFVYQDVRGCYLSEGTFRNMTPHLPEKVDATQIDESSDTYDTVAWLLENVPHHNGKAGQWGISYPGFYTAAGMIDHHPALVAVSPQAPIADWYYDDFHHHGAFFLPHAFNFMASFGRPRAEPTTARNPRFRHGTPDGYQFFLDLGPLKNADQRYLKGEVPFWNEFVAHPDYDEFWQARNILPHLHRVPPAVMTVGGWFDAEDLYGTLKTYRAVEANNPDVFNILVMGPWRHGGWARGSGDRLGNMSFGGPTSPWYQEHVELPFFRHFLKGEGELDLPEALVYETGVNRWRRFEHWPPENRLSERLYLHREEGLAFVPPAERRNGYDQFLSDPDHPVPFTEAIATGMTAAYMTDDQRFAGRRPDVLVYRTPPLERPLTVAGPVLAKLWVSTSGTASDWVVKLIDEFPAEAQHAEDMQATRPLGGYQMMVRSEVLRGRYRNSYETPEPFVPHLPTPISLELLDVLHTFEAGHRVVVQVQCTWFPLVDRNPHRYVENIFLAEEADFIQALQRVHHSPEHPSHLELGVLPSGPAVGEK